MIDERYLADPDHCPSCASLLLDQPAVCPTCRLPLQGPIAGRLWRLSVEASGLLTQRSRLITELRDQALPPAYAGEPTATTASAGATGGAAPSVPDPAGAGRPGSPPSPLAPPVPPVLAPPSPPRAPRPEWTPRRVQNLLLALGVGLLGVAAVIFVAVSWGRLGVGGRAAVMTGVTAVAAYAGLATWRRGLTATAEALSLLTVGLALLDCAGARASDLAGLGSVDGAIFAAGSSALVALAAGAGATVVRTRALRLSAAVLAQLPLPLLVNEAAQRADHPAALVAAGLAAQALVALVTVVLWPGGTGTRDARTAVAAGGTLAGVLATASAVGAAYVEDGSLVVGTALLLVVAVGVAAGAEAVAQRRPGVGLAAAVLRGLTAAIVVTAVWAPLVDTLASRWIPAALAGAALVLLAGTRAVPAGRRSAPAAVLLTAACGPGLAAGAVLSAALAGRLHRLEQPWSVTGTPSARAALQWLGVVDDELSARWGPVAVLLLVVATALVLSPALAPALRVARTAAVPVALAAGLLVAPALDTSYAVGLGTDLALGLVALVAGTVLVRAHRTGPGTAALASGSAVIGLAGSWSIANDVATLVVLPAAAAVLVATVLVGRGVAVLRGARVGAGVAAGLLLVAEAGAVTRYAGSGWAAVHSVALGLLTVAALSASLVVAVRAPAGRTPGARFWAWVRRGLAVIGAAAGLAEAGAASWWLGAGPAGAGLAVAVAAAVLLAAATVPAPARLVTLDDLRAVAGIAAVVGLLATATDADRLWPALLAVGVGTAVLGVRGDHRWGWLAGLLLAASSWVRLALSDVDAPEAYTVLPALALLAVGARRRRLDPAYRSWNAYAPGLGLALVPSLLRAVTDAQELRPFLLGVAALAVLGLGVARRLQAPLVIGAGVLAVDAVVQLAPYLAAAYDAVPRWVAIGLAGLVLLGAGATFEQRVRDVRRVGRHVTGLV